jgi:hypothetical protein
MIDKLTGIGVEQEILRYILGARREYSAKYSFNFETSEALQL